MKLSRSALVKVAGAAVALAAAGTASLAHARSDVYFSVGAHLAPGVTVGVSNAPVYYPPVYVAPPPVYYAPQPVYVRPAPIYYAPAPVYYSAPPVYYGQQVHYRQHWRHDGRGHHHSRRHGHWR